MAPSQYRDILQRLSQASSILRSILPYPKPPKPSPEPADPPRQTLTLSLDVPQDFTAFLAAYYLDRETVGRISDRIEKAINDQKSLHQQKFQELCGKLQALNVPSSSSNHLSYYESVKKAQENAFQRQLSQIKAEVIETCERLHLSVPLKKAVFNSEYRPVLEQYFEYNAFPSARDRELLARKSCMTPRQIEVWFQNHRRRARKEGRPLRRISTDPLPADLPLDTLKEQLPDFMLRKEERRSPSIDVKDIIPKHTKRSPSPLAAPAPAVLFSAVPQNSFEDIPVRLSACPPKYSPRDGATLFSTPRQSTFEAPIWYRKASSPSPASSSPSPSIEELCSDMITKLHIGGAGSIRKQRDPLSLDRFVATRQRFALEALPTDVPPPAARSTTRISAATSDDVPIAFGSTSFLRCTKRPQPYDRSLRKYPNWSLDKPEPRSPLPSFRERRHIPRRPSVSSYSSSGSSLCSDPPTPRDSPNAFAIQALPFDSPDTLCDPYAFDFSADILVTSSYPSSTERYAPYKKPSRFSRAPSPSYPRFSAY